MASIRQWHEAFQTINNDRHAKVLCPECGKSDLVVKDTLDDAGSIYQRSLYCPTCKEERYLVTGFGIWDEICDKLKEINNI